MDYKLLKLNIKKIKKYGSLQIGNFFLSEDNDGKMTAYLALSINDDWFSRKAAKPQRIF
jgi:hypothetical protein